MSTPVHMIFGPRCKSSSKYTGATRRLGFHAANNSTRSGVSLHAESIDTNIKMHLLSSTKNCDCKELCILLILVMESITVVGHNHSIITTSWLGWQ